MGDGMNAGVDAVAQALAAERMTRRFFLMAMRFVDNGIHLFFGKRCLAPQLAVGFKFVIRGGVELDPVRSIVNLFADSLACPPRAIHPLGISPERHPPRNN